MRFKPTDNHTYRPLSERALDDAWHDATGSRTPGAPRGLEQAEIRYQPNPRSSSSPLSFHHRQRKFYPGHSITTDRYWRMHNEQGGVCAICKNADGAGRRLALDHCHSAGTVRGLLCTRCNLGLGYFKDNVSVLAEAIYYLSVQSTVQLR